MKSDIYYSSINLLLSQTKFKQSFKIQMREARNKTRPWKTGSHTNSPQSRLTEVLLREMIHSDLFFQQILISLTTP